MMTAKQAWDAGEKAAREHVDEVIAKAIRNGYCHAHVCIPLSYALPLTNELRERGYSVTTITSDDAMSASIDWSCPQVTQHDAFGERDTAPNGWVLVASVKPPRKTPVLVHTTHGKCLVASWHDNGDYWLIEGIFSYGNAEMDGEPLAWRALCTSPQIK